MTLGLELGLFRRRRVRLVLQTEVAECGLAALAMVANYYGLQIDIGTLRRRFEPSLRGASLRSLIATADQISLIPRAVKVPLEGLSGLQLPAVLHWNMNHFVVVEEVAKGRALIHDPESGSRWLPLSEVSLHYTGIALELRPSDEFQVADERARLRLRQLWQRLTGLKRALLQTAILTLIMQAFVLASPYYMQVAIDSVLPAQDFSLLTVLAVGFALFTIVNAAASVLRTFVLLSAGTALGYGVASNVARRLLRLPIAWFEKRHVGDVLSRFQSIAPIRQFMTEGAIGTLLDGSLAILTLALMFFYSSALACVALSALVLYMLVRTSLFSAQRETQEEVIMTAGKEQSNMIESLRGIVTLRLFNRETMRHAQWQSKLVSSMNSSVALARLNAWQVTANTLIFGLETIVSVWIAIRLVMNAGFSVGMMFAYFAYKTEFLQRASSLVDQGIAFRMLGLHLERLSDIALADVDPSFSTGASVYDAPLQGNVELRSVSFQYSPTDPFVLKNVSLSVSPGEHIAITGPSGGGKTTLVKVLLGLMEPSFGEIVIDGQPLRQYGYARYREQVGAVLQDDSLFGGSLSDNIALFDEAPDMDRVIQSAQAAALHEDIRAMPMGYETLVGDMGSSLSGGQRQRLLLARALYRGPRLLVMDEGTSHLDSAREQAVNAAIGALGITRIIIAHRLETILSAQRIYAVTSGSIEEITDRFLTTEDRVVTHQV